MVVVQGAQKDTVLLIDLKELLGPQLPFEFQVFGNVSLIFILYSRVANSL